MRFSPEVKPRQIPRYLARFRAMVLWENLVRKVDTIEQQLSRSEVTGSYLAEMAATEIEIVRLFRLKQKRGALRIDLLKPETYSALSFVAMSVMIHARLSEQGKLVLASKLRGAMNDRYGFDPVRHEFVAASHLLLNGWTVSFEDLEGTERFDLLAKRGPIELELECKSVSVDKGRKVHRWDVRRLWEACHLAMNEAARLRNDTLLLRVEVADRLPSADKKQQEIVARIEEILRGEVKTYQSSDFTITRDRFDLPGGALRDPRDLRTILGQSSSELAQHTFLAGTEGAGACVLTVQSRQQDLLLDRMYRQLREAHKQLSGDRAAIVWVNVADIEHYHWEYLRQGSGLQQMTYRFLAGKGRQNVCSVAYSSAADVIRQAGTIRGSGSVLHYDNVESPFYDGRLGPIFPRS